jgi:Ser/Thr protein kinase RdoA (MazF antagonist)
MARRSLTERKVGRLEPGDAFGDWLASVLADRLAGWRGGIRVYRIEPASHVVCRYEFAGTAFSVIGKFFGAPTGAKTRYNADSAMRNEFRRLRHVSGWIRVPHAIATNSRFQSVLVTEYVPGRTIRELLAAGVSLYDPLTGVAHLLHRLHDSTRTSCKRERDFAYFHSVLDQNGLPARQRKRFDRLLGAWWHSARPGWNEGCMVHGDATLSNYLFDGDTCAIDFEGARNHTHPVRDLGILASELKTSDGGSSIAEDCIGHLLWHYSRSEEEFRRHTAVLPFFMALGHLRIARLPWRAAERDWLLAEAEECLAAIYR